MKLDTSDCPDPRIDLDGYRAWFKRERDKNPPPNNDCNSEEYGLWVTEFSAQTSYTLQPKPLRTPPEDEMSAATDKFQKEHCEKCEPMMSMIESLRNISDE